MPVVLRRKLGKGFVYLFNSYSHPGRGNLQILAEMVMRAIVEKFPAEVILKDKNNVVSWFKYSGEKFDRYFFVNTDWTQPDRTVNATVSIKGVDFSLSLAPAMPVQIATNSEVFAIIKDPFTQIADWRKIKNIREIIFIGGDKTVETRVSNRMPVKIIKL